MPSFRNATVVLVLFAPAIGAGRPPATDRPEGGYQTNTIDSVLARIEPDLTDPAIRRAYAEYAATTEPRSPYGVYVEQSATVDPAAIQAPTLMIHGARDPIYRPAVASAFFDDLATTDKSFVVIPDAGHFLQIQRPRLRLYRAIERFLLPDD